ncbi:WYL domain-containing protein [Vibrio cholerae]|nr:WYL domain-containing protein [Vibrio cholerae]RBM36271.1 WYL domain-containing protein [Vibrio tarriae]EJF1126662.1 WYL domain-containing protein [Vibrio cholerae]EJL6423545.1 WYL domain-containing protein [Vibrio cholerae]EJL7968119.1 WYL domain-containing protein [Vibrio cholerae]
MVFMESLQEKRLRLIDFYLMFYGKVNRADLMKHGEISIATASRTFSKYRESYPENVLFDVSKRSYVRSESFEPQFSHNPLAALRLVAWGIEESKIETKTYGIESFTRVLDNICAEMVSEVTRAIVGRYTLRVTYCSSNATKERVLSPHSIFHGLGAWHVRCWDKDTNSARSFRLSRITAIKPVKTGEYKDCDTEWNCQVTLSVAPHSKHNNRDDLAVELGMEGKPIRNIQTNAVLAGYVLNDLRVDCSPSADMPPQMFNLQLMNRHEVEHIESIQTLAPGFK